MTNRKLIEWLRQNSSGIYRPSAEAADLIEQLIAERKSICGICEQLQDSPQSFLQQMTAWAKRIRAELDN